MIDDINKTSAKHRKLRARKEKKMMECTLDLETMIEKRGITAYRLAVDSGISQQQMWKLKHGKFTSLSLTTIAALCSALDCTPNDILVLKKVKEGRKLTR